MYEYFSIYLLTYFSLQSYNIFCNNPRKRTKFLNLDILFYSRSFFLLLPSPLYLYPACSFFLSKHPTMHKKRSKLILSCSTLSHYHKNLCAECNYKLMLYSCICHKKIVLLQHFLNFLSLNFISL